MRKKILFLIILVSMTTVLNVTATPNEIVVHTGGGNHGFDQISVDPPYVTYDDDLNELYVYFGSTSTIDLEYLDPTGMPCTLVNGESHPGYTSTTYYSLPAGYYTITIHSIYGYTYYGNFTVY